jgi:hypothetical protein
MVNWPEIKFTGTYGPTVTTKCSSPSPLVQQELMEVILGLDVKVDLMWLLWLLKLNREDLEGKMN